MVSVKSKKKTGFVCMACLMGCIFLAACSSIDKEAGQTVMNEQEISGEGSSGTTLNESVNFMDIVSEEDADSSDTLPEASSDASVTVQEALNLVSAMKDHKTRKVIRTAEDYNAAGLPLIGALYDKDIYLYGMKPEGAILYMGGKVYYYNWLYLTPRFILPEMQLGDFDEDGKEELAVILYTGSGTGFSIEDLHIIEISGKEPLPGEEAPSGKQPGKPDPEYLEDHMFKPDEYLAQLHGAVSFRTFTGSDGLMGEVTVGIKKYTVDLKEYQSEDCGKINEDVVFGDIVGFRTENVNLQSEFAVGITCRNYVTPIYIGAIHADVDYGDGKFILRNLRFEANPE